MKTDCFLQGLDWLTLKEVEEEGGGGGITPALLGPWAGTVGAGAGAGGMGTVGAGEGGGGGAETLGRGARATGAMPAPGRGGKSSSKTYSVQREVKQLTLHYCYEVYEHKNIKFKSELQIQILFTFTKLCSKFWG